MADVDTARQPSAVVTEPMLRAALEAEVACLPDPHSYDYIAHRMFRRLLKASAERGVPSSGPARCRFDSG